MASEMQITDWSMGPLHAPLRRHSPCTRSSHAEQHRGVTSLTQDNCFPSLWGMGGGGVDLSVSAPFTPASLNPHLLPSGSPTTSLSPQSGLVGQEAEGHLPHTFHSMADGSGFHFPLGGGEDDVTTCFMASAWELNESIHTTHLAERRPYACIDLYSW